MVTWSPLIPAAWRDVRVELGLSARLAVRIHPAAETAGGLAPARPLVLHLPGGAFTGGDLDTALPLARLLAHSGATVVSLDYPRAPFPLPLQAAAALLRWLQRARSRLAGAGSALLVAGEEAGANLAAGLALWARDQGRPLTGQLLVSPLMDPCLATASLRESGAGDCRSPWSLGWRQYLGRCAEHPYATPLRARRLSGVAPALVLTAQDDPLRDEAAAYARALRAAGVAVRSEQLIEPTGWPHALSSLASLHQPWVAQLKPILNEFWIDCLSRCPPARRPVRRAT